MPARFSPRRGPLGAYPIGWSRAADRGDPAQGVISYPALLSARNVTRVSRCRPPLVACETSIFGRPGDHVAISGPQCGKSTLLHLLGCVDAPSGGTLLFDDRDVTTLGDRERSHIRLTRIGFVFQRFYLMPMLTAAENVELPQGEAGVPRGERRRRTMALLYVGLSSRADTVRRTLRGEISASPSRGRSDPPRRCWPTIDGELDQRPAADARCSIGERRRDRARDRHARRACPRAHRILTMRDGAIVSEARCDRQLAMRSLFAHPVRSACGRGFGTGVRSGDLSRRRVG